jgi:hypothetical protein
MFAASNSAHFVAQLRITAAYLIPGVCGVRYRDHHVARGEDSPRARTRVRSSYLEYIGAPYFTFLSRTQCMGRDLHWFAHHHSGYLMLGFHTRIEFSSHAAACCVTALMVCRFVAHRRRVRWSGGVIGAWVGTPSLQFGFFFFGGLDIS